MIAGILAAFIYFADHHDWRNRASIGAAHALAHVLTFLIVLFVLARNLSGRFASDFWIVVVTAFLCGLINPTIIGCYLLIALNGFSIHWNEAFSSPRLENYKGFLRLKIDRDGTLTIYPVVIEQVPVSDDAVLRPRLAEKPIEVRPNTSP